MFKELKSAFAAREGLPLEEALPEFERTLTLEVQCFHSTGQTFDSSVEFVRNCGELQEFFEKDDPCSKTRIDGMSEWSMSEGNIYWSVSSYARFMAVARQGSTYLLKEFDGFVGADSTFESIIYYCMFPFE